MNCIQYHLAQLPHLSYFEPFALRYKKANHSYEAIFVK